MRERRPHARQHRDGLRRRGVRLGAGDPAVVGHAPQDVALTFARRRRVARGVVRGRPLREAGEVRGVREVQVARADPEVHPRGGLDPVGLAAVVDVVQVEVEDVRLRAPSFELERDERLVRFAERERRGVVGEVEPPRELLRDRRRARALRSGGRRGARDRERIDADVPLEAAILGRDRGLEHPRGDRLERDRDPQAVAALVLEDGAVRVEDDRAGENEPRLGCVERREARNGGERDERRRRHEREPAKDRRAHVGQVPPPFLARRQTCWPEVLRPITPPGVSCGTYCYKPEYDWGRCPSAL